MKHNIGIMQGRLSPSIDGKIQFFPWKTWEKEFPVAASLGFFEIEFIFELENYLMNPVYSTEGTAKIRDLIANSGVKVNFICADYFMEKPFFRTSEKECRNNVKILNHLIYQASKIGAKGIEIPLVDNSSIKTKDEKEQFIKWVSEAFEFAERFGIEIGLETDLGPMEFKDLLEGFAHPLIKANYDTGNSASLGYDPEEEFSAYGKYINNIHIKDRLLMGGTVPLGTGSADLPKVAQMLKWCGYKGGFILQAARAGDDIENAKKNLEFVSNLFGEGTK